MHVVLVPASLAPEEISALDVSADKMRKQRPREAVVVESKLMAISEPVVYRP